MAIFSLIREFRGGPALPAESRAFLERNQVLFLRAAIELFGVLVKHRPVPQTLRSDPDPDNTDQSSSYTAVPEETCRRFTTSCVYQESLKCFT